LNGLNDSNLHRSRAKATKNKKFEARNPKQIQMTKMGKIPNELPSDPVFWIFLI